MKIQQNPMTTWRDLYFHMDSTSSHLGTADTPTQRLLIALMRRLACLTGFVCSWILSFVSFNVTTFSHDGHPKRVVSEQSSH